MERGLFISPPPVNFAPSNFSLDPDLLVETRYRLLLTLSLINLSILGASTLAGYFLAGRTLEPIKNMVDEQNRFITDASHELRTPLTALKSGIEVNLRNKNLSLPEAKELLKSNLEDVNDLQGLSDKLIKLSRFELGDNGFPMTAVNLALVVNQAVRRLTPVAKTKNISIITKISDSKVTGNDAALTELFIVILDNAIKYSPPKTKIHLTNLKTDGYVSVEISDHGIGIDEKDIPHLFDRFYRSDKSRTKTETPGYGLGLSIAKQIADKHHGIISVRSKLGKGSVFTVKLPVA